MLSSFLFNFSTSRYNRAAACIGELEGAQATCCRAFRFAGDEVASHQVGNADAPRQRGAGAVLQAGLQS